MATNGFDTTYLNNVTRKLYIPAMRNILFDKPALFNRLKNNVKTASGSAVEWTINVTAPTAVGLTGGYDPMATQQVNPTQNPTLSPAKYFGAVSISGDEKRFNSGGTNQKLQDMLKNQISLVNDKMIDTMVDDMYGSSTTRGNYNTIVGLAKICSADRSYGGVDSTTYPSWDGKIDSNAHTIENLKDPQHTSYMPYILMSAWANASHESSPNLFVLTPTEWVLYQTIMNVQNLQVTNSIGDAGFLTVKMMGYEVLVDTKCTAYSVFVLSTDTLSLYVYPEANFDMVEPGWRYGDKQDAMNTFFIWQGQLVCSSPRCNEVLNSVGAS